MFMSTELTLKMEEGIFYHGAPFYEINILN